MHVIVIVSMTVLTGLAILNGLGLWVAGLVAGGAALHAVSSARTPPVSSLSRRDVERILEQAIEEMERGEAPKTQGWRQFIDGHFEDLALQLVQYDCLTNVLMDERDGPIDEPEEKAENLKDALRTLRDYDKPL